MPAAHVGLVGCSRKILLHQLKRDQYSPINSGAEVVSISLQFPPNKLRQVLVNMECNSNMDRGNMLLLTT